MKDVELEDVCKVLLTIQSSKNNYFDMNRFIEDLALPIQKIRTHFKNNNLQNDNAYFFAFANYNCFTVQVNFFKFKH